MIFAIQDGSFAAGFFAAGVLFAFIGIVMVAVRVSPRGRNKIHLFGQTLDLSQPALVIFVMGCGLMIFPFTSIAGSGGATASGGFPPAKVAQAQGLDQSRQHYSDYVTVHDDTGALTVQVPAEWKDVSTSFLPFAGGGGSPLIIATTNADTFYTDLNTPGIWLGATSDLTLRPDEYEKLLDLPVHDHKAECKYQGRLDYSDKVYQGRYDSYTKCNDGATLVIVLVAYPADKRFLILLEAHAATEADVEAINTALRTFDVKK